MNLPQIAIPTFVLIPVLISVASCVKPPQPPERPNFVPVTTALVVSENVPLDQSFPGIVVSPRSIDIDARVEGFLLKQELADGAVTKPGDVIYRIDPRPFEASLAAAEGSLIQAIAERDYARKEMERNAPLVPIGAISQQDFDHLVASFEADEGQVMTAKANVATAKINLSYCTMASPFVGLLGASKFFEGAVVGNVNSQNLNSLVQIDPLWIEFSPSETQWPRYAALMAAGPLTATVTYDGHNEIKATGKVIFVDNQVSTSTATLMMRVEFSNPNQIFRPGAYAQVSVALGTQPNVMMVPMGALFARETDLYVWRVKPDDTVEEVQVQLLKRVGTMSALMSGPNVGDRIVVQGIQRLKTGSKIKDMGATAAATSTTPATPAAAATATPPAAKGAPTAPVAAPAPVAPTTPTTPTKK